MKLVFTFLFALSVSATPGHDALAGHAERARAAQQTGDFQTAAAEWEAIVKLDPGLPEAHSNVGMMWHFAHRYPKAIPAFREALRLNPKLIAPHLFLGIDYYLTYSPDKAIPELKTAISLDPGNAMARKWLAMSYFQSGDFLPAAHELNLAISQTPGDPELLFWLSRTYSKILFKSYARIRELAPQSKYLSRLREDGLDLSDTQDKVSNGGDTLSAIQNMPGDHTSSPEYWYRLGRTAKILALKELSAFLEKAPQSYRVYQLQAEYSLAQGDDDKAIGQYRHAIAISPSTVQLHTDLGNIYMSRHQYAEAIPEYEAELRTDAYSLIALERIGQAYAELNDSSKAESYLKRALAIDPHAFEALRALGKVCYERGDYRAAVANYREAINSAGHPPAPVLFQLSKAYRKLGNNAEADRWLVRFQHELAEEHSRVQQRLEGAREQ